MSAIVLYDYEPELTDILWHWEREMDAEYIAIAIAATAPDNLLLDWLNSDCYERQVVAMWCLAWRGSRRYFHAIWAWIDDTDLGGFARDCLDMIKPQCHPYPPDIIYIEPTVPRQLSLF